jgi:hypothetical protein
MRAGEGAAAGWARALPVAKQVTHSDDVNEEAQKQKRARE